jgi:glycosyltransferase involved in cell wall biosynthesis
MRTQVGFVNIWNRPNDPRPWSGVPTRLMDALREIGAFGGYLDATPWPPALKAWGTVRRVTRRPDSAWFFDPVPQAMLAVSNTVRRTVFSGRADAWLVPAMGLGRPVRGRVASLSEMSPAQLRTSDPEVVSSFWPRMQPAQMCRLARQQERLHRAVDVCCVASSWAGGSLVEDHGVDPGKVHVIGYGANVHIDPPADRDWSMPRFLFSGLEWHRKNGDRVVRAFSRVRETFPDATLDIVGDHPLIDVDGVTTHGRWNVHEPDGRAYIESLYRCATCFVLPSLLEPFGIVYVEAAGAGLASIGTSAGGTVDSIGHGGLRVHPTDEVALVEAMLQMAHPEEARSRGAVAHDRSRLFTWRKSAERVVRALAGPGEDVSDLAAPLCQR